MNPVRSTPYKQRITDCVRDPYWQSIRISMKGQTTEEKLQILKKYHDTQFHDETPGHEKLPQCNVCVRLFNYIRALVRGGQLYKGQTLETAIANDFDLAIKRER